MRDLAPHTVATASLQQLINPLGENRNLGSPTIAAALAERIDGDPRWLSGRIAPAARVASRDADPVTSPFDFPRAPASYVRAGGNARCPSSPNGDLHGSYHVECV